MPKEIERKFFVADLSIIEKREGSRIVQGYLADEPMTVRVRIVETEAFLTLKSKKSGIACDEYEFPISLCHAEELLTHHCGQRIVHKTRYRIPHENLIWEVDVFAGKLRGLVIAEVELDFSEQVIALPEWIGREISDDRRYSNSAMSRTGQIPSPALSLNIIKN
jgi:CYTH domain-containing protein